MVAYVKMRERAKAKGAWWFVTPNGGGNRLRIHASRFESMEKAEAFVAKYTPLEPDLEFKAVEA